MVVLVFLWIGYKITKEISAMGAQGAIKTVDTVIKLAATSAITAATLGAGAAAGAGLSIKKTWSIYPVAIAGLLQCTFGVTTLYSSIGFAGFGPSPQTLAFNLALIGYIVLALGLTVYTLANRSLILGSE